MNKFGLLGEKIAYSYSPKIHKSIQEYNDLAQNYELIEVKEEDLDSFFHEFKQGKYQGINVTIPYKEKVIKYLDEISLEAKKLGNVNTIKLVDGKLYGYNTDYFGLDKMLDYYNIDVLDKKCIILGTGGAAKTAYNLLLDKGVKSVFMVSRNKSGKDIISYDDLKNISYDFIINATPVGTYPNVLKSPLADDLVSKASIILDLIYNPSQTAFLKIKNSLNNGLPMLYFQALKAEEIWYDKKLKACFKGEL